MLGQFQDCYQIYHFDVSIDVLTYEKERFSYRIAGNFRMDFIFVEEHNDEIKSMRN